MSTIADFNRIEDCDKIDPLCIDAYTDFDFNPDSDTGICLHTPWGGNCLDLTDIVKAAETCTTLYLSPEEDPNCLIYEPECGENICIHGDDLSRIISMTKLKDVDQSKLIGNGEVYIFNSSTEKFEPYDITTVINNLNTITQNLGAAIENWQNRMLAVEAKLVPPDNAPADARVLFGNINILSDYNATVNSSGVATSLDRTHGVYGHDANQDLEYDELMG